MSWDAITRFALGSLIVIVDAVVGPIYRRMHRGSRR